MQKEIVKEKDRIRKAVLDKRNQISPKDLLEKSSLISEKLFALEDYNASENLLIYASMKSEVITDGIIDRALKDGKMVFCPKCMNRQEGIMEFIQIKSILDLKEGYMGIREPQIFDDSVIFDGPIEKTLVVVPGVAFDKRGNRIGYKGGYYDRFLFKFPGIRSVALAFTEQLVDEVPYDVHDIPIDKLLYS